MNITRAKEKDTWILYLNFSFYIFLDYILRIHLPSIVAPYKEQKNSEEYAL